MVTVERAAVGFRIARIEGAGAGHHASPYGEAALLLDDQG
jgi:hypothetical protein